MYGFKLFKPKIPYVLVAVVVTSVISWATGFKQECEVALSAVDSPKVHKLVDDFNAATAEIEELATKRTEITQTLAEVKRDKGEGSHEYLHVKHELDSVNIEMHHAKEAAGSSRHELRLRLLRRIEEPDGSFRFRLAGDEASDAADDGRTWRLRVSNGSLDGDSITLTSGGAVVGAIPRGLPALQIPKFSVRQLLALLPSAVIISLLGFMEAISIAKAMAAKTGQVLDPNRELIGQGLANIFGSVGQSYPISGSFSRSAVNLQSGAVSGLSSVFTSIAVAITLCLLTPLLYHLPQATLAAIIMMAVIGLVSVASFVHAWKTHRIDGGIQIVTFITTLAFAPHLDRGIMVGVSLSLAFYLYRGMKPNVAHLSLHPDGSFRDAQYWGLGECERVSMIRFDAPLFFANASFFEDLVNDRIKSLPNLRHILLVANGINDMDASGEDVLALTVDNVRAAGIELSISGIKENVLALMKRTHLYEKIGEENIYPTQAVAIEAIHKAAHEGFPVEQCDPLACCPLSKCAEDGGATNAGH